MSKVEIDTSEVSLEEQVEAALLRWTDGRRPILLTDLIRDFAAGKFAKQPLPEIVRPKWLGADGWVTCETRNDLNGDKYFCVMFGDGHGSYGMQGKGPRSDTQERAIHAFNALFGAP